MPLRPLWLALALTAAIAGFLAVAVRFSPTDFSWGPPETPKVQCEALDSASLPPLVRDALARRYHDRVATAVVREPQNTWSNLAFIFVGLWIVAGDRRPHARLLSAALIALGLGSGLYHASLLPAWRNVDVATMAWTSFALCHFGWLSVRPASCPSSRATLIAGLIGGTAAIIATTLRTPVVIFGQKPFATTFLTTVGIGIVFTLLMLGLFFRSPDRRLSGVTDKRRSFLWFAVLTATLALAVACQLNDRPGGCLCRPDAPVQGHAVWHVLMAAALAQAYLLFCRFPVVQAPESTPP